MNFVFHSLPDQTYLSNLHLLNVHEISLFKASSKINVEQKFEPSDRHRMSGSYRSVRTSEEGTGMQPGNGLHKARTRSVYPGIPEVN